MYVHQILPYQGMGAFAQAL